MEYYLVDKFNRGYYSKPEPQQAQQAQQTAVQSGESISFENNNWNAKRRKITNVQKGSLTGDVVTFDQTLTTVNGREFEYNGKTYLLLEKDSDLDMNNKKILHLSSGNKDGEAVTFNQLNELYNILQDVKNRVEAIEKVGKLYSVTDTYFSTNKRRIVSLSNGIDPNDAVTKSQLDQVDYKVRTVINRLNPLLKGLEVTDKCIKIKGNRKICNIAEGTEKTDAVAYSQHQNVYDTLVKLHEHVNRMFLKLHGTQATEPPPPPITPVA